MEPYTPFYADMITFDVKFVLLLVIAAFSVITFILMGVDKWKAKRGKRRIRESTLFLLSFCFGGIGTLLGMLVFRHKTKHLSFLILVPVSIIVNILAAVGAAATFGV